MLSVSYHTRSAVLALAVCLTLALGATPAHAQTYVQLQVLLPGEIAAPGTGQGKLGTPQPQVAGIPFDITVRACDVTWNTVPVTNVVSITSSDANANLSGNMALANGEVNMTVTLNSAGSFTFTTQDESDPTIPTATSAAAASQILQGFTFPRVKRQIAGRSFTIDVTATDPNLNRVNGFNGAVQLRQTTSLGPGRIVPDVVTFANGRWIGTVTVFRADETNANRGNVTIDVNLVSDPSTNGISNTFVVEPNQYSRLQIVVPGQTRFPGSVSGFVGSPASQVSGQNFNVDVWATDDWWNPVNSTDRVRVTSSDPLASTPVSRSMNNGNRQFTVSLGTFGLQTLTATNIDRGSISPMTSDGILVGSSGPDHFEFDPISSPIVAGDSVPVTIRATDINGNTVPGYNGNGILAANTGPGSISPEAIVFTSGVWTGSVAFRGAGGVVSVTCSDFAAPPHIGVSNSFQVTAGPYTSLQVLLPGQTPKGGTAPGFIGTPTDQSAGFTFNATVRAVDQFWNRVTNINNRFSLASSDSFAAMPSDTLLVNGELIFPVILARGGNQTITATDVDSTGIAPYTSSPVFILPGTFSQILLIAPGEIVAPGLPSGRAGTATDQSINFAFTVTVYAVDQWFNPMTGVTDSIRITSGDPLAQLPPDAPLIDGRADMIMTLSTGGFQQITATNLTQPLMAPSTTQVRAISSGFHLEATVSPTAVVTGEPFNLTVQVTNDAGSVIQEINSFIDVAIQNAATQAPGRGTLLNTQFQLLQGQRTVAETYTFAEDIVLVISDDAGNAPAVTPVISVSPGAPASIQLTSNPSWVQGNSSAAITARVVDTFDNGVPAQPVIFQMVTGTGSLSPIDSLTDATGAARATFASPRIAEIDRIRAISGAVTAELDIETAFVDPSEPPGTVTNYPNPFHPNEAPTTIAYKISDDATVTLRIYTLSGGLVFERTFDQGTPGGLAGLNEFQWDGRNGEGEVVASGGYIAVVEAVGNGETLQTMRRKIAVVR